MNKINIFWFRRDLRLHDNHGLYQALLDGQPVLCVFIFDKNILAGLHDPSDKRVAFIHQALVQMNETLRSFGSSIFVLHDTPRDAFLNLTSKFEVGHVFTNHDYEPYALKRDAELKQLLLEKSIPFHSFKDQVIFEKSEVVKQDNTPYTVFTPFAKSWKEKYLSQTLESYPSEKLFENLLQIVYHPVPSLSLIGFLSAKIDTSPPQPDHEIIKHYHQTRNLPYLNGTSRLSVHLRFGTVSIREVTTTAIRLNEQWLNELIWREFFMMILFHFPRVVTESFKIKYDAIPWINNESDFEAWRNGETGYPLVDAGMRELNETGFMHNRVRMVVASFLTKHLLIDWRRGEAYFAEKLIDYELSSNNGNWQWCAGCGCDAAPYFRIFNPTTQAEKFDPDEKYIKTWIKDFKPGYIVPIVDHEFARKRALEVYKRALNETR